MIFGPKPRDWSIKMNKKERRLAMSTALVSAAESMICVEDLNGKFDTRKTKSVVQALERWGVSKDEKALLITKEVDDDLMIAGRNIEKLTMSTANALDIFEVLRADKIVVEESALEFLRNFYNGAETNAAEEEDDSEVKEPAAQEEE